MGDATHRNRLEIAISQPADPGSLVGSFFHGQGGQFHSYQGCVVGEPSPGVYLVEFFGWIAGESTNQRLVRIDEMTEWLFYDDAVWMNNAYEHGVSQRWERQRKAAEQIAGTDQS
jgi:hypothetical protein